MLEPLADYVQQMIILSELSTKMNQGNFYVIKPKQPASPFLCDSVSPSRFVNKNQILQNMDLHKNFEPQQGYNYIPPPWNTQQYEEKHTISLRPQLNFILYICAYFFVTFILYICAYFLLDLLNQFIQKSLNHFVDQ